jgi:hypothetical protein
MSFKLGFRFIDPHDQNMAFELLNLSVFNYQVNALTISSYQCCFEDQMTEGEKKSGFVYKLCAGHCSKSFNIKQN